MIVLAGDIGGTHSRLALQGDSKNIQCEYRNAEFSDLYQVIEQFLDESGLGETNIKRMVLGLPAPVGLGTVNLTNIDWQVDAEQLRQRFPVQNVLLVNDFQAAAVGGLSGTPARQLNPDAQARTSGPAVVTGAGTGLGHAWVGDISSPALPWATEGGHVDFAPQDDQQYQLHAWLARRLRGHVSMERLLSGPGLETIFEFLNGTRIAAADITLRANEGDSGATTTIDLFMRLFGSHVGNLALLFNPVAGIHLCGGVVRHLNTWFGQQFLHAFRDKGRMQSRVEPIPLYLHDRGDIGLQGALQIALREYQ